MHGTTLYDWTERWAETYKKEAVSAATWKIYKSTILPRLCNSILGGKTLNTITGDDVQTFLNNLVPKYSKSTVVKIRNCIRSSFALAEKRKIVQQNPVEGTVLPKAKTRKILPYTHAEEDAIRAACSLDRYGYLLTFLLTTGLRKSEMCMLEWCDYDRQEKSIFIQVSKTEAGIRKVYLIEEAARIIETHGATNSRYIFSVVSGNPVSKTVLRRLCERIEKETKISNIAAHQLRHTFVTRLCEAGVAPKAVAQLVGHKSVVTVLKIYAEHETVILHDAIHQLEKKENAYAYNMQKKSRNQFEIGLR